MKRRIGVFLPNWVGDVVMATPTLRSLRDGFPEDELIGVARPVIGDLLAGENSLDRLLLFNKKKRAGLPSRWGLIGALRELHLDSMVLLTNSLWTAAVAKLAGVRRIVGFNRDARGWLLTDRVAVPKQHKLELQSMPISTIEYYLRLATHLGCDGDNKRMHLNVTTTEASSADDLWNLCKFVTTTPTVVINSNSATEQARLWPAEKVKELAVRLATEDAYQVLLHCGPAERDRANQLAAEIGHPLVASMGLAEDLPIGLTKAVVAKASAVVSTDSGPRHIAVALDRPVVSLFGPTDPLGTRTFNLPEQVMVTDIECRPCNAKSCRFNHSKCLADLEVDRVYRAVIKAIES